MSLISPFDPWHSTLCTCPEKLTFNPYTGCDHQCLYCYATSYIPHFTLCRPKKNLFDRLKREANRLSGELVSISSSSDPYPNMEAELQVTRRCLEILCKCNCKIHIVTKSPLVTRDIGLLKKVPSVVSLTVTTDNDELAGKLEPSAPQPMARLKAAATLVKNGLPVAIRVDPVIPFLNDDNSSLLKKIASAGVRHITCSTLKVKYDTWLRLSEAFPDVAHKLKPLYYEVGQHKSGNRYLPETFRFDLMKKMAELAGNVGLKFGTCREGLSHLNTAVCDGSWLLDQAKSMPRLKTP